MEVLLGTVFIASLLGSLHCVGMCGPFALLASSDATRRKAAIVPTMAYSFGRLLTYTVVGCVFGTLGMALNLGTSFSSWQQSATYLAGGLMILVGLIALARCGGVKIELPSMFSPMQKMLQSGFSRATGMSPLPRAFAIGALTSLMPCGWLYTFAITAAGTGHPVLGMIVMVAFWAGTVPIMAALMMGVSQVGSRLQQRLPILMASMVLLIGIFTIIFRAPVVIAGETNVVSGTDALTRQVQTIDHETLPCCCQRESTCQPKTNESAGSP
jgi:sulfite exporter TauE/SafE